MRYLIIFLLLISCAKKTKSVLICGDHVCINNDESNQYFRDNLSLEVRVLKKKTYKYEDLVEYNLSKENKKDKTIILSKVKDNKNFKELKILNKKEKKLIKEKIKIEKKKVKKVNKKGETENLNSIKKTQNIKKKATVKKEQVDICSIIEKCDIEGISEYILKKSKGNKFPDITSLN